MWRPHFCAIRRSISRCTHANINLGLLILCNHQIKKTSALCVCMCLCVSGVCVCHSPVTSVWAGVRGFFISATSPRIDSECDRRGDFVCVRKCRRGKKEKEWMWETAKEGVCPSRRVCVFSSWRQRERVHPAQSDQCFHLSLALWTTAPSVNWIPFPITGGFILSVFGFLRLSYKQPVDFCHRFQWWAHKWTVVLCHLPYLRMGKLKSLPGRWMVTTGDIGVVTGERLRSRSPNPRDGRAMSKSTRSFVIFMLACKYTDKIMDQDKSSVVSCRPLRMKTPPFKSSWLIEVFFKTTPGEYFISDASIYWTPVKPEVEPASSSLNNLHQKVISLA